MSKKKRPPVAGRRSNYAHLTEVNLQDVCHRNVKRIRGSPGREASIPLLMSRARLREPTKLSPGGFQISCPYQPERPLRRNLGKKTERSGVYAHPELAPALSLDLGKKKRPPGTGRRSNYAHLTEVNLQDLCHRNVKRVRGSPGREASIPLLMSKARLREPIKLSPGGFQTSCPYQPERQFPRNLGKKPPPVSGRRSTSRRRYGGRSPESMLIRSLLRHLFSNQLGRGQKKNAPQ